MQNVETTRTSPSTDTSTSSTAAVADSGRTRPRELARRLSGTVEVLLLWHPGIDLVELSIHDLATEAGFRLEIAPENANDAFYHPYAYAVRGTDAGAGARLLR
jgi:hypothetical protein